MIRTERTILCASSVYLLRIKENSKILPEYLAVYLNSIPGQRNLSGILTNGTIRTLLKRDLEKISIPIPSVEKQKQLVHLNENIRKQQTHLERKIKLQNNMVSAILNQLERSVS